MHRSMSALKFVHSRKHVDDTSMCMSSLTLVLRISLKFSHYCFFFSKPIYLRVTIEFWRKFQKIVIFCKKCVWFFFHQKIENLFFGSNCSSFILQLNAENRININAVYNEIHVFKLFLYGIYMIAIHSKF